MDRRGPRARHPFGIHQAAEYLIGIGVLLASLHAGSGAPVVAGAGAAVLLLAACTDGPLAAWHVVPPALHRALDFGLVAALAALPFVVADLPGIAIGTMVAGAALLGWLTVSTRYVRVGRPGPEPGARQGRVAYRLGRASAGAPRRLGRAVGSRRRPR